jgi:hypothetical protein
MHLVIPSLHDFTDKLPIPNKPGRGVGRARDNVTWNT